MGAARTTTTTCKTKEKTKRDRTGWATHERMACAKRRAHRAPIERPSGCRLSSSSTLWRTASVHARKRSNNNNTRRKVCVGVCDASKAMSTESVIERMSEWVGEWRGSAGTHRSASQGGDQFCVTASVVSKLSTACQYPACVRHKREILKSKALQETAPPLSPTATHACTQACTQQRTGTKTVSPGCCTKSLQGCAASQPLRAQTGIAESSWWSWVLPARV